MSFIAVAQHRDKYSSQFSNRKSRNKCRVSPQELSARDIPETLTIIQTIDIDFSCPAERT